MLNYLRNYFQNQLDQMSHTTPYGQPTQSSIMDRLRQLMYQRTQTQPYGQPQPLQQQTQYSPQTNSQPFQPQYRTQPYGTPQRYNPQPNNLEQMPTYTTGQNDLEQMPTYRTMPVGQPINQNIRGQFQQPTTRIKPTGIARLRRY